MPAAAPVVSAPSPLLRRRHCRNHSRCSYRRRRSRSPAAAAAAVPQRHRNAAAAARSRRSICICQAAARSPAAAEPQPQQRRSSHSCSPAAVTAGNAVTATATSSTATHACSCMPQVSLEATTAATAPVLPQLEAAQQQRPQQLLPAVTATESQPQPCRSYLSYVATATALSQRGHSIATTVPQQHHHSSTVVTVATAIADLQRCSSRPQPCRS